MTEATNRKPRTLSQRVVGGILGLASIFLLADGLQPEGWIGQHPWTRLVLGALIAVSAALVCTWRLHVDREANG